MGGERRGLTVFPVIGWSPRRSGEIEGGVDESNVRKCNGGGRSAFPRTRAIHRILSTEGGTLQIARRLMVSKPHPTDIPHSSKIDRIAPGFASQLAVR